MIKMLRGIPVLKPYVTFNSGADYSCRILETMYHRRKLLVHRYHGYRNICKSMDIMNLGQLFYSPISYKTIYMYSYIYNTLISTMHKRASFYFLIQSLKLHWLIHA